MAKSSDQHWIPLADLMTGLMMMFLLIAVLYMLKVSNAVADYSTSKNELGEDLCQEFALDLKDWDAECDTENLVVRFKSPDVLFDSGESALKPEFKNILDDFFPRYIKILSHNIYKDSIEEIRIEGHTSSKWSSDTATDDAYFLNMQLSQARTLSVLQYVLSETDVSSKDWVKGLLTANGLSSSKLIYDANGLENDQESRRVEFRVRTNADKHIQKVINDLGEKP